MTDEIAKKAHDALWKSLGYDKAPATHEEKMQFGAQQGWWEKWDDKGPLRLWYVDVDKFKTWAHMLAAFGLFSSISEARRAGHDKPVVAGTFSLFKGREQFIIE